VGRQNHCNSKQILKKKRKRRMAKDNNPTPNKFKVSPWLVYTYTAYLLFISFITGSSVYKNHQATSSKFNELLDKGAIEK
jgi:cell division protease FtsH